MCVLYNMYVIFEIHLEYKGNKENWCKHYVPFSIVFNLQWFPVNISHNFCLFCLWIRIIKNVNTFPGFTFICVIVILNMLIACMSNTMAKVTENLIVEWTFSRTEVCASNNHVDKINYSIPTQTDHKEGPFPFYFVIH